MKHEDLREKYPQMNFPMRCQNGCGAVIEIVDGYRSYKRDREGKHLLFCQCCAAEEGHIDEDDESHDDGPVCHRKPKTELKY